MDSDVMPALRSIRREPGILWRLAPRFAHPPQAWMRFNVCPVMYVYGAIQVGWLPKHPIIELIQEMQYRNPLSALLGGPRLTYQYARAIRTTKGDLVELNALFAENK